MADTQRSVSPVILIVGGVAIVAAALYALWAFVLSGNSSSPTGTASGVPSAPAPSASAQVTEGGGGVSEDATTSPSEDSSESSGDVSQVLPETFEVYTARNPFEQLIRPRDDRGSSNGGTSSGFGTGSGTSGSSPIGSTPGTGSSSGLGGATSTTRPNTPVSTNPSTPGSTPVATNPSSAPSGAAAGGTSTSAGTGAGGQVEVGATRVRLQSVGADNKAVVTVNGVDYNPSVGEQFAQRFKLLSVNKSSGKDCATMLFGDSRFSICAGQVIDK